MLLDADGWVKYLALQDGWNLKRILFKTLITLKGLQISTSKISTQNEFAKDWTNILGLSEYAATCLW